MPAAMPGVELVLAERGRHAARGLLLELHRQRAVVDELGEILGVRSAEVPADLDRTAEVGRLERRIRLHDAVEHDRDLILRGRLAERLGRERVELREPLILQRHFDDVADA